MKGISHVLVLAAVLAVSLEARADWVLSASQDGGAFSTLANGAYTGSTGTNFSGTFGNFAFNINLVDMQTASQALLSLQSVTANNQSALAAHSLDLRLADSGYTMAGSAGNSLTLTSNIAADRLTGTGLLTFQTLVSGGALTPLQTVSVVPGSDGQSASFIRGATLGLQNDTTITLGASGQIQETGSSEVNAAPEPATLGLALAGAGFAGGFALIRRKRKA